MIAQALRVRRGAPRPRGWAGYLAKSKEKSHTRMKHHGKPHHTAVSTHHWLPPAYKHALRGEKRKCNENPESANGRRSERPTDPGRRN